MTALQRAHTVATAGRGRDKWPKVRTARN